jgi:hypothetical protein
MKQLSFGEQLKVILRRRGMTIKGLADLIEEHTEKKMSRQNLTQRLGRDNFQEQDMRMIAEILGCPFTLNILTPEEEELKSEKVELVSQEKTVEQPELVVEEKGKNVDSLQESSEELIAKIEDDIEGMDEELEEELEEDNYITVGDLKDMSQELTNLEKEANFRSKGIFLRVKGVDVDQSQIVRDREEERPRRKGLSQDTQEFAKEDIKTEESKPEEVLQGEMNPYTGKEYETNSVRTHPSRIGYVQVYDRGIHRWKDMTEWAFLGYQERKKAILGSRYEEPIYLD